MFEMDVRMSQDGVIVVCHDESLLRCTDAESKFPHRTSYNIWEFSYEELSSLDAGSWFAKQLLLPPEQRQPFLQGLQDTEMWDFISLMDRALYVSGKVKIPTLKETLNLAQELNLMVNIELKTQANAGLDFVTKVIDEVNTSGMAERVRISSFSRQLLQYARSCSERISLAFLTDTPLKAPVTSLKKLNVNAYHLGIYNGYKVNKMYKLFTRRYINHLKRVRNAGFVTSVWTCNEPREAAELIVAGIDGIISDYPNRVKSVLDHKLSG